MTRVEESLSNAHRAILLIAKAYVSQTVPRELPALLRLAKPESLARIAQSNHVHTLAGKVFIQNTDLRDAIPRDLFLYFKAMYEANQQRSAQAHSQLKQIDNAFTQQNIPCVVMKGGGDLLDPLHRDQNIRFIGDLDILVPHELLDTAQATLSEIGANAVALTPPNSSAHVNQRGVAPPKHHLPKIIHSDWALPVELHFEVGRNPMDLILPANEVLSRAQITKHGRLMVMSPQDRACHLIAHASHHGGDLDLRSWIDWTSLRGRCDLPSVKTRLEKYDLSDILSVFEKMSEFLDSTEDGALSRLGNYHTHSVVRRFGDTRSRRLRYIPNLFFSKAKALSKSPEYRRYVFSRLFSRSWWYAVLANHLAKMRNQR